MPTINVQAQVSAGELLAAAGQLPPTELDGFVSDVLAMRAGRRAPQLSTAETELLVRINRGLPADGQRRSTELIAKRRAGTISPEEHAELIRLTDEFELLQADRAAALASLAELRRIPLADLMRQLGLNGPDHE